MCSSSCSICGVHLWGVRRVATPPEVGVWAYGPPIVRKHPARTGDCDARKRRRSGGPTQPPWAAERVGACTPVYKHKVARAWATPTPCVAGNPVRGSPSSLATEC